MPERPTGPEDPAQGPEIRLTPDQFEVLALFVPKGNTSTVRLRDMGSTYVQAELLDAAGNVTRVRLLYPLRLKHDAPAARPRSVADRRADSEEEGATRAERPPE
jgi:hypothetical protein